jgi:hypothetical protein
MDRGRLPTESPGLRAGLRSQLRSWHVRSFVAFPIGSPQAPDAVAFFTWLFGRPPVLSAGGTYGWFGLKL